MTATTSVAISPNGMVNKTHAMTLRFFDFAMAPLIHAITIKDKSQRMNMRLPPLHGKVVVEDVYGGIQNIESSTNSLYTRSIDKQKRRMELLYTAANPPLFDVGVIL